MTSAVDEMVARPRWDGNELSSQPVCAPLGVWVQSHPFDQNVFFTGGSPVGRRNSIGNLRAAECTKLKNRCRIMGFAGDDKMDWFAKPLASKQDATPRDNRRF